MSSEPQTGAPSTAYLLSQAARGDEQAHGELLRHVGARLLKLTRRMLRGYPHLQRWEQTDDIYQTAVARLYQALTQMTPESAQHFWHLAALQIRRTLIDLARTHFGPEGQARHHHSDGALAREDADAEIVRNAPQRSAEPVTLEDWTAFHEAVDRLPEGERDVFQLVWYSGLTQQETADTIGVSLPTVQRRWYAAQVSLYRALQDKTPPPGD
jgi:RNA polymerase sigma-70 factor (ECF subfamily)